MIRARYFIVGDNTALCPSIVLWGRLFASTCRLENSITVVFLVLSLSKLFVNHVVIDGSRLVVLFIANVGVSPNCSMIQSSAKR